MALSAMTDSATAMHLLTRRPGSETIEGSEQPMPLTELSSPEGLPVDWGLKAIACKRRHGKKGGAWSARLPPSPEI